MANRPDITPEILRQLVEYDPETGKLFWRPRPSEFFTHSNHCKKWNARFAGATAGHIERRGYVILKVFECSLWAHRAAWALHYGMWPKHEIDHINGIRSDNRIENLRDIPHDQNQKNIRLAKNNTSGVAGVSYHAETKKWQATIDVDGKRQYLGLFSDKSLAADARAKSEAFHGFH